MKMTMHYFHLTLSPCAARHLPCAADGHNRTSHEDWETLRSGRREESPTIVEWLRVLSAPSQMMGQWYVSGCGGALQHTHVQ